LYFLQALESILISLYSNTIKLIICRDININYLKGKRKQPDSLLSSFNVYSTIQFPTRIHNNSTCAIDNIINDRIKNENHSICPFINGLPDYDAQIITIHNITPQNQTDILKLEENLINTL